MQKGTLDLGVRHEVATWEFANEAFEIVTSVTVLRYMPDGEQLSTIFSIEKWVPNYLKMSSISMRLMFSRIGSMNELLVESGYAPVGIANFYVLFRWKIATVRLVLPKAEQGNSTKQRFLEERIRDAIDVPIAVPTFSLE
jgi:hypothetical protein